MRRHRRIAWAALLVGGAALGLWPLPPFPRPPSHPPPSAWTTVPSGWLVLTWYGDRRLSVAIPTWPIPIPSPAPGDAVVLTSSTGRTRESMQFEAQDFETAVTAVRMAQERGAILLWSTHRSIGAWAPVSRYPPATLGWAYVRDGSRVIALVALAPTVARVVQLMRQRYWRRQPLWRSPRPYPWYDEVQRPWSPPF
jgi:hypothetical protein